MAVEQAGCFSGADQFSFLLEELLVAPKSLAITLQASLKRFEEALTWPLILGEYETLLARMCLAPAARR